MKPAILEKSKDILLKKNIMKRLNIDTKPKNRTKEFLIFCLDNSGTDNLWRINVVKIVKIADRKVKDTKIRS